MESNQQAVDNILTKMQSANNSNQLIEGLNILAKLVSNLISNPFQQKYRSVKITNNTIKSKVMNLKHITDLLTQLGYILQNEETYILKDERIGDFLQGSPALDYKRRLLIAKSRSQQEYKKQLYLIKLHKEQLRAHSQQEKQTKRLKQQCDNDKKQRKHMKVDESKSNTLKFGTQTTTYKDIGVDLCAKKGG